MEGEKNDPGEEGRASRILAMEANKDRWVKAGGWGHGSEDTKGMRGAAVFLE